MTCTYTYMYSSGPRTVDNVESIEVRADGSHTLIDADNVRHRMEAGWLYYGHPTDPAFQAQEPVVVMPFVPAVEEPQTIVVTVEPFVAATETVETVETVETLPVAE